MSDQQFDDFLKGKLKSRQYELKPEYWSAAEALLDQEGKARRRPGWWFWVLLMFGLAIGGFASYGIYTWLGTSSASDALFLASYHRPVLESPGCQEVPVTLASAAVEESTSFASNTSGSYHLAETGSGPMRKAAAQRLVADTERVGGPLVESGSSTKEGIIPRLETDTKEGAEQLDLAAVYALKDRSYLLDRRALHQLAVDADGVLGREVRHFFQMEAGFALAPGWQNTGSGYQAYSLSPSLGLGYAYVIRPNLRLQAGIRYQGRGALDSDSTYLNRNFGFGVIDTLSTVAPGRLHSVAIPLRLDLRVGNRHYLQAGLQPSFLLNASGELVESVQNETSASEFSRQNVWGYRQGFQAWDLSLIMGYRYYLGRGIRVGISGQYGLTDQTQATFFQNNQTNRHIEMRLMLEYDLGRW